MKVDVHLHGILRDHLPPEAKGRASVSLDDGASIRDLLIQLGIKRRVVVALNNNQKPDDSYILQDGDKVTVYTIIGGGQ